MMRAGIVYVEHEVAGDIAETADGIAFTYRDEFLSSPSAQPVSLTLPLRADPYLATSLHPFFAGLLAEGTLAEIQCRTLRVDERDLFGRLLATCHDTIGAVTVRDAAETGPQS